MASAPFPPLVMADSERDRLEFLAHRLIHKALQDYDAHRQSGATVDARSWKLVRRCDQLAMYKRAELSSLYQPAQSRLPATAIRSRAESASIIEGSITQGRLRQKMPTLLQVGAIRGSLNQVMYGTVAVDGSTMMLKTACTDDTLLDGETLCQLRGPSAAHPFRFLGVKWVVKGTPHNALAPLVRPRDLVFVEATGILTREGMNERVGYHLTHSVSVPGYGPLDDKKIMRAQISSCIFYTETPESPGSVDVYMKARFDPNGNVSESVATHSASLALMYGTKASVFAQNKKLLWLLRSRPDLPGQQRPSRAMSIHLRQRGCPICAKSFSMLSSTAECKLCSTVVCAGCSVKKMLPFARAGSKRVAQKAIAFCTSCLTHARRLDDHDAAKQEVLGVGEMSVSRACTTSSGQVAEDPVHNCRRRDLQEAPQAPPGVTRHHSEGVMANKLDATRRQRVNTWGIGDSETEDGLSRWDKLEQELSRSRHERRDQGQGPLDPGQQEEAFQTARRTGQGLPSGNGRHVRFSHDR
jgi:hypothetical protein